jgi:hypothetical protein
MGDADSQRTVARTDRKLSPMDQCGTLDVWA